jgi:DNA-binding NarL/FixJ family response regulator
MHPHNDGAIRVRLVNDLPIVAWGLERLIDSLPALDLAGATAGYDEALRLLGAAAADVIVVDLDGIWTRTALPTCGLPRRRRRWH